MSELPSFKPDPFVKELADSLKREPTIENLARAMSTVIEKVDTQGQEIRYQSAQMATQKSAQVAFQKNSEGIEKRVEKLELSWKQASAKFAVIASIAILTGQIFLAPFLQAAYDKFLGNPTKHSQHE